MGCVTPPPETVPTPPDVLADRYASAAMVAIWSPERKVVAERELWLAVLEALAAGTPVGGSRRGGVGELIDETVGQRAETTDTGGLAEAICAIFARDIAALSQAARRRAEQRHGWDTTFQGLTRIYERAIQGTASRPLALSA